MYSVFKHINRQLHFLFQVIGLLNTKDISRGDVPFFLNAIYACWLFLF